MADFSDPLPFGAEANAAYSEGIINAVKALRATSIVEFPSQLDIAEYKRIRQLEESIRRHGELALMVEWKRSPVVDTGNALSSFQAAITALSEVSEVYSQPGLDERHVANMLGPLVDKLERILGMMTGPIAAGAILTFGATPNMVGLSNQFTLAREQVTADSLGFRALVEASTSQVAELLKQYSGEVQNASISFHAKSFESEAAAQWRTGAFYLGAACVAYVVAVCLGQRALQDSLQSIAKDASAGYYAQVAVSKTAIIAIPLSVAYWLGKAFRAAQHNYIVNKHRANSLRAYLSFAGISTTDAVKEATLLHVTAAIFSHQSTGFAEGESDSEPFLKLYEKLKETGGKP